MKANEDTSTQSVVSPPISTLQQLKKIAEVLEPGSYRKKVRRLALALRLTVALGRKLTGSVVYAFLDFALVPGSEAHTRLSSFVRTDQNGLEVDTASSTSLGPSTHLQDELEIYCYFIVLLFLIDQKKYKEAKECSSATIGRLKRENMRTVDVIASKLFVYYYLRQELADDLAEIRRTLVDVDQLAPLETEELAKTNFRNTSFSPSIQMTSSQFDEPSSQFSDAQPRTSTQSRNRWSPAEDLVLISAWLNTSKDAVVSNYQTTGGFWTRIADYYAASEDVVGKPQRDMEKCKMRWKKINAECNKFAGCYRQASSRRASGQSEDDVLAQAHKLYDVDVKRPFTLDHAWRQLRSEQKWLCSFGGNESSKRTKLSAGGDYSSSSNTASRVEEEASPRPPGNKAAKRKGKKTVSTSQSEDTPQPQLQMMLELKEKDIDSRDKAANKRVLAALLAKPFLSETEQMVCNKLLSELYP